MSQRQEKYIAQLLRAHHDDVMDRYRAARAADMTSTHCAHYDRSAAKHAMRNARTATLIELAEEANLLHFESEVDDYMSLDDYGDFVDERERKRVTERYEADQLVPMTVLAWVRDRDGTWEIADSLGGIWVDTDTYDDNIADGCAQLDLDAALEAALYRHRDTTFGPYTEEWVPGHVVRR